MATTVGDHHRCRGSESAGAYDPSRHFRPTHLGAKARRGEALSSALVRPGPLGALQTLLVVEVVTAIWQIAWQFFATEELAGVVPAPLGLFHKTVREYSEGPDSKESGPLALSDISVRSGTNQWA